MTDPWTELRTGLEAAYTLERQLGRGGMATVFLARDLKHDRPVALKVLHPELAMSLGPERFLREIKLAARLQHPHILTVLDSGETAGRLWFTMPFVEGESLRDRLRRERQLPVEDALRIAREAAQALQYAHDHGIVHRDIKPENLLLTQDGNTLVADFGIAKLLREGQGDGGTDGRHVTSLTETGLAIGTPAYMSPEQAAGDKGVDARSDIYSLAAVLYEMLTGEPPFHGPTTQAMLVRRMTEPPPSARVMRVTLPEGADQAIRKALSPTPADRFATMAQFGQALQAAVPTPVPAAPTLATPPAGVPASMPPVAPVRRRSVPVAATALVLGILIGLGVLFAWRRGSGPPSPPEDGVARIVVLPFENLGDTADAYFAEGVADAVRGKLTELPQLQVIARSSSVQYAGSTRTPAQIAEDLGVQYLLTGTVRWARSPDGTSRVQVSPELVQVGRDGAAASKWQRSFEAPLSDVFKVQADIAGQVAQAMRVALPGAAQARLAEAPTRNEAAYDAYLRARAATNYGSNDSPAATRRAIAHLEEAVRLDSAFAQAWGELSLLYLNLYYTSTPATETAKRALAAAERALSLDSGLAIGHRTLGWYALNVEHDPVRAAAELELAARAAPSDPRTHRAAATIARVQGRFDDALTHAREGFRLDPLSPSAALGLGDLLLYLRRPAEARSALERALALAPTSPSIHEHLVMVALSEGDLTAARQVVTRATEIDPVDLAVYMATYWDLGWVLDDAAQQLVLAQGLEAFDGDSAQIAIVRAQLYDWRGDPTAARRWGDVAQRHFAEQLREAPDDPQRHVLRGLALAYAGRSTEATSEGERGLALGPIEKDWDLGPYIAHQLARIYVHTGQPEKAIDQLERLVEVPYFLTRAWLRIDPEFAPLRSHPRFVRLVGGTV